MVYVKYNRFDQEQNCPRENKALDYSAFIYDAPSDTYTCPEGQTLSYLRLVQCPSRDLRIYEAPDCTACPFKARCSPKYAARRLFINAEAGQYRRKARELLNSPPGKEYRSRRMIEVESVFGQIKHNGNFRLFLLRGLPKVTTEFTSSLWSTTSKSGGLPLSPARPELRLTLPLRFSLRPTLQRYPY